MILSLSHVLMFLLIICHACMQRREQQRLQLGVDVVDFPPFSVVNHLNLNSFDVNERHIPLLNIVKHH